MKTRNTTNAKRRLIVVFLVFLVFKFLEVEVALTAGDFVDVLGSDFAYAGILDFSQLLFDEGIALGNGVLAGKVHEILLERHDGIG